MVIPLTAAEVSSVTVALIGSNIFQPLFQSVEVTGANVTLALRLSASARVMFNAPCNDAAVVLILCEAISEANEGKPMEANTATMAIVTISSIKVNPLDIVPDMILTICQQESLHPCYR